MYDILSDYSKWPKARDHTHDKWNLTDIESRNVYEMRFIIVVIGQQKSSFDFVLFWVKDYCLVSLLIFQVLISH